MQPDRHPKSPYRAALWSIYFHSFYTRTLRRSVFELTDRPLPFRPIPLTDAIDILLKGEGWDNPYRQFRALRRLETAGFLDEARWNRLREAAQQANDKLWLERLDAVRAKVRELSKALDIDPDQLSQIREARRLLYEMLAPPLSPSCQTYNPSCIACHNPSLAPTGRPATTVTARALVSRTPEQIAKLFDPRSWGSCFDHFDTQRVDEKPTGGYKPHYPDPDPIGQPWDPTTVPHLIKELISIEDDSGGANLFENVLKLPLFEVTPSHARLEFDLKESTLLKIPSLALTAPACVSIDKGYMDATQLIAPGPNGPWSQVEVVKTVQFVDITQQGGNNPFGLDPGEFLNYLAPAILCLWLEDLTQGAVCCPDR